MDRELSSDRGHYGPAGHINDGGGGGGGRNNNNNNYGGGGGYRGDRGGGGYRGGRGGGYRGQHGHGGRGRHGRNDYQHHHHNNSNNNNNNRPRFSGNRFAAETESNDPQVALRLQLQQMLCQVGQFPSNNSDASSTLGAERTLLIKTQAQNIQSLTNVLTGSSSLVLLKYNNDDEEQRTARTAFPAEAAAGPLVTGLIHCVSTCPLQTPCYAALTLAVHEHSKESPMAHVAVRAVRYATQLLARDLDSILWATAAIDDNDDVQHAVIRIRLTLRYLALLAIQKIVQVDGGPEPVPAATNHEPVSFLPLLEGLVQAAEQLRDRYKNASAAHLLALVVLSTVPYLVALIGVDQVQERLVEPLQRLCGSYVSAFAPGMGMSAILLKNEQLEDMVAGEGDVDEDDDDDIDEDEDDASGQVCDSFQDLKRAMTRLLQHGDVVSRFALLTDNPWSHLEGPASKTVNEGPSDEEKDSMLAASPLEYTDTPQVLHIFPDCACMTALLSGRNLQSGELSTIDFHGVIFGRLPIFGPPPEANDEEDDDEEDDDMEQDTAPKNERLVAYQTKFGLVDRYLLAEAVRDCVICHESTVADAGVEHGSAKHAAEQVWSLTQVVTMPVGDEGIEYISKGLEYVVVETLFSLVVQATGNLAPLRLIYVSRVMLELVRIVPAIMSPAIALAVSHLFADYMPSLVPMARHNLSRWFAFHMINTDYQWPAAFWKHWEPYVMHGWGNSRGSFVKGALALMTENVDQVGGLVRNCLPRESVLVEHLLPTMSEDSTITTDGALHTIGIDIRTRIWDSSEDVGSLLSYMTGDELSEIVSSELLEVEKSRRCWWRSVCVIQALLAPIRKGYIRQQKSLERTKIALSSDVMNEEDGDDDDDDGDTDDILSQALDAVTRYRALVVGVVAMDAHGVVESYSLEGGLGMDEADVTSFGEMVMMDELYAIAAYSRSLVEALLQSWLEHKIVAPKSLLRWSLGDGGTDDVKRPPVLRWWEMATMGMRFGLEAALVEPDAMSGAIDTNDDEVIAPGMRRAKAAFNYADPLLGLAVKRVCGLLSTLEGDQRVKKFTPVQIDLSEGLKYLVRETHNFYKDLLRKPFDGDNALKTDIHDALIDSGVSGRRLAALCSDFDENAAIETLRKSLEQMYR